MTGIGGIVYRHEIHGIFLQALLLDRPGAVAGVRGYGGMALHDLGTQWFHGVETQTKLVKHRLEAIIFQHLLIIWRVEVHAPQRFMKTLYQQAPPFVPLAEIDRP